MKKSAILALSLFIIIPAISLPLQSEAASNKKAVKKLVGSYEKEISRLKGSKDFINKRVLFVVEGEKKATTIGGLLAAVEIALSGPQHSIFVDPIVLAQSQQMGYAKVQVNGAFVKSVDLSRQPPADQQGLAALVLDYEGDSTLALQVMVNIKTE